MSDGDTITAALFNNEYNQLVNAFAYSSSSASTTGHRHDGSAGQGGSVHTIGDLDFLNKIVADSTNNRWGVFVEVSSAAVEQLRISDGVISPVTDNDIDLGTSSLEFKDLFIDGTAHIDTLDVDVNGTVAGTFGVTGATTLSSTLAVTGAVTGSSTIQGTTITATTAFVPDASDGAALGTSALEFSDLFLADGAVINFGDDQDVSLTHVADTGLLLSSTDQLQFGDSGTYIYQSADGVLDLVSDTEIELTATTIDINGAVAMDGAITGGTNITISGELDAATLDISGNADIDGTLEADAYTVDGTALNEYIADTVGAMVGSNTETNITVTYEDGDNTLDFVIGTLNQDTTGLAATATALATARTIGGTSFDGTANIAVATATEGTNVTVSANNSTDETVYPTFVDGATGTQGIETDTGLTYNPSTGMLTTTGVTATFTGNITGNVTGNTSGTAATVTTAAQSNITSLGTLTALTVDNLGINGNTITANSGALNLTPASGSAIVLDGTISVDAGVVTGATAITLSGELDAGSLDISGDADIDGTLEADAITIGGVTLAETIADTVGAMVSSNTESGITVAYQDADNTLDFTVGTLNQDTTGTAAIATTVTITDNESTNETNAVVFTAGGDVDGGNLGLESDGDLTYNPSSGTLAATAFTGALTGNVTGNASGTAATVTGGTQASITAAANLVTVGTIGTGVWQGTAIASSYIAADAITGAKIADDAIDSEHYTDGSIDNAHIADDAIDSEHYAAGSIDTAHIADDQVTGAKIENAVTIATSATSPLMVATTSARITQVAITSSSNATAWDAAAAANAYYVTSENTTFAAPSNATEGAIISVEIAQGGTARTVAWNTIFEFAGSSAPTITATANKTDILAFRYNGSVWQEIGRVQNMAQT